ncbi:hypothetical protein Q2T83_05080 [Fervidibacter sacchari]|uniref:Uncharacterized protein n=1 Tax=Candidatus Fervidibacter sacchari TaxID=1448929 RepID=A0ABT2EMC5_9BACT|nr:hypothetical protein [Candidatus Fervidibacter sacchari]MCS3919071.1 hypothetical protein [Candidatus Fervidibacter sacchari]WKU17196.1 hypothetical protein Q2T83_05080 [Candidatus Fervidibacter sacchari]
MTLTKVKTSVAHKGRRYQISDFRIPHPALCTQIPSLRRYTFTGAIWTRKRGEKQW